MAPRNKWREVKKKEPQFQDEQPKWEDLRDKEVEERVFEARQIRPLNNKQTILLKEIEDNILVYACGYAGTGKSTLAIWLATQYLNRGEIKKIIITRPLVECDEKTGFLPGELFLKLQPFMRPMIDILETFYDRKTLGELIKEKTIEIIPLAHMRGLSFHDTVVIADECQNATFKQLKLLCTRIGENSKLIICSDNDQSDLDVRVPPIVDFIKKTKNINKVSIVNFEKGDIVRSGIVRDILECV